ncbi:Hypothetical predicted protein [Olea europaea subsp. europaea]|uniref:Uncharacterized protein n=1 Tax=Olea europaea subsp. europaea TaxID=158383 RepID=A0A8S0SNZ6_OLEEU|nr:Hypothetical predicted protein [Olea europaea subsp. europaea]
MASIVSAATLMTTTVEFTNFAIETQHQEIRNGQLPFSLDFHPPILLLLTNLHLTTHFLHNQLQPIAYPQNINLVRLNVLHEPAKKTRHVHHGNAMGPPKRIITRGFRLALDLRDVPLIQSENTLRA